MQRPRWKWMLPTLIFGLCFTESLSGQNPSIKPAQPWAGATLKDWDNASQARVITDLSRCQPASALSEMVLKKNRWKVLPYRMSNDYEGKMIWASPEAEAAEVSLPLEAEGWYAIFVGLFSASELPTMAWIRLDTDPAPVPRINKHTEHYGNSEEVFFRAVRLSKENRLLFSPQNTGETSACGITHVKLIPLTNDEIRRIEEEKQDPSHRVLAATNDGFSDMFHYSPRSASSLMSQVEIFKDTDFGTLILHSGGGDKVNYPSKIGAMMGSQAEILPRVGDRYFVESSRALAEKNINPLKTLIDRAHEIGMTVYVANRPAGWSYLEPWTDFFETPFYKEHPQWRCEDRDGTPVTRMSWAVPEVRRHLVDLLREQVQFGADGANLVFTRGYPVVLYETPARQLFQEQYGIDPHEIPESDQRITAFRTMVVTKLFHELRAMLDQEGQRVGNGKRLKLSVIINGTAQDDLIYGVDLRRLVSEKLVDEVFTEYGFGMTDTKTWPPYGNLNLTFLREVCDAGKIHFSPGIYKGSRYSSAIPRFYENGVYGLTVWDAAVQDVDLFDWYWMSRFGHVEETLWRLKNLDLKKAPRTIYSFKKLGDQIRDGRFGPYWGG